MIWFASSSFRKDKFGEDYSGTALQDIGQSPAAAGCFSQTVKWNGNRTHVQYPQKVQYTTAPPAFGNHWNQSGVAPVAMDRKFYTSSDRPPLEALVHNLEHGYTILWYDQTVAGNDKLLGEIRGIARKYDGTTDFRDKFIAVPWTSADEKSLAEGANPKVFPNGAHIALSHWSVGGNADPDTKKWAGQFLYCNGVSGAAVKQFTVAYPYTDSPEPPNM
jgi:hypothetical protein